MTKLTTLTSGSEAIKAPQLGAIFLSLSTSDLR